MWLRRVVWVTGLFLAAAVVLYNVGLRYSIPHASRYARWVHFSLRADAARPGSVEHLRYRAMADAYKKGADTYEFETSINPAIGGQ